VAHEDQPVSLLPSGGSEAGFLFSRNVIFLKKTSLNFLEVRKIQ